MLIILFIDHGVRRVTGTLFKT
jgi:adenylate kinase family enzyme